MPKISLKPFWQTADKKTVKLYHGDVIEVLKRLRDQSVHCCVTSPPYWGLRDYGTDKTYEIGSESSPDEFVQKMVEVFREVKRVLRDDGVCWVNLGDSYGQSGRWGGNKGVSEKQQSNIGTLTLHTRPNPETNLKPGNLVGTPWRVALALQADGWILRQDIIWAKPSPMPESVKNRCTKAHEYIFLLAKKSGYYYDAEAIKEKSINKWNSSEDFTKPRPKKEFMTEKQIQMDRMKYTSTETHHPDVVSNTRNKRSVWSIASESYSGAHFATFPRKLITPCILAGTSEKGCCSQCGTPWKRVVERQDPVIGPKLNRNSRSPHNQGGLENFDGSRNAEFSNKTTGWKPECKCNADILPCVVLDPFCGSGTTCCVSLVNGRRSIGIDLSEKYLEKNAIPRIEGELLSRPALSGLAGKKTEKVELGEEI